MQGKIRGKNGVSVSLVGVMELYRLLDTVGH